MKRYQMRRMSSAGDSPVIEWDETATPERLEEIEKEFNAMTAKGYFAADMDKGELIREFNPSTNILMIPRLQGGM